MTDAPSGPSCDGHALGRRRVLGGAAALGLAAPVLAACGSGASGSGASGSGASGSGGTQAPQPGASKDLVAASDVPVGGGVILADQKVVVTQPAKGDFQAFSAVCTHQGCLVTQVSDGIIQCPCHGSQYSVNDGSVVRGPAPDPLPRVRVSVQKGEVVRA